MSRINSNDVQVREIQRDDLADLRRYFFESTPEFLNSIGLKTPDPVQGEIFQSKSEQRFDKRDAGGAPIPVLTVLYLGERVGFHTSTHHDPGNSLVMHAHFFRSDLRGLGIGTVSYVLAIEKFLTDYGYREVLFKTPKQNLAPIRIKEKLGLLSYGEDTIDWPELLKPLPVRLYRVESSDLRRLKLLVGI